MDPTVAVLVLNPVDGGVWETNLPIFSDYFNRLYMYRITNEQGALTYKVDVFSRNQVGRGAKNPGGAHYTGSYLDLDGIVSCSIVSDPDQVTKDFDDTGVAKNTGTFSDAMGILDDLVSIGVNTVELLPVLEFDGDAQWGYGTSLFICMQTSAGGANQMKHFVRACHQRGIAVILDVCYDHFATNDGERTEWAYDADPNAAP